MMKDVKMDSSRDQAVMFVNSKNYQKNLNEMIQIIEQTHEEKMSMYMKQSKKKLAEMIIECNRILESQINRTCQCPPEETTGAMQEWVCNTCGRVQENENIK